MKGKEVTKECSYCKVQKDLSCFGKSKAYKSGINGRCKECMNASNKRTQAKDPHHYLCLLYTSPSPRDAHESRMPSSA